MLNEDGWCPAHDPERAEARVEAARKAGRASAAARKGELTVDELPPLDSYEAAETWLERVMRAMIDDRISQRKADTLRKIVKVWLRARDQGVMEDKFQDLEDALREYRDTGDARHLLEVVDGDG